MKKFFDIKNWRWWQIALAYTIVLPLFGIIMNLIVEQKLDFEDVTIKLAVGAVLGSIFGGIVEFVRRDKAKTERNVKL